MLAFVCGPCEDQLHPILLLIDLVNGRDAGGGIVIKKIPSFLWVLAAYVCVTAFMRGSIQEVEATIDIKRDLIRHEDIINILIF